MKQASNICRASWIGWPPHLPPQKVATRRRKSGEEAKKLEDSLNFQAENPRLVPPPGGSASKPGFAGEADQEETVGSHQVEQTFLTN